MLSSDLIADAKDIMGDMADLAQTWTTVGGGTSWQMLIDGPNVTQDFTEGGFIDKVSHTARVVASTSSWTTSYGSSCAAAVSSGSVVSTLAIGKTLVATEEGNRQYRVEGVSYKPGSAWVELQVRAQDDR